PFRVVGVMPPGFNYPNDTDVWHRLQWDFAQHSRGAHFVEAIFRLKPNASVEQANGELAALTGRLGTEFKSTNAASAAPALPAAGPARPEFCGFSRPARFARSGAAAFLLLTTCTNVASLLLARATVREREVAVRAAIGASRGRLVRQFLTESILLAALGTTCGVVVAIAGVRATLAAAPIPVPRLTSPAIGIDARVLLFACAVAALTAIAFGIVPAAFMTRGDVERPL